MLGDRLKLIVMLRNPIDRAVSGYVHHVAKGRLRLEDDRIRDFHRLGIMHIGLYNTHIQRWLETFPVEIFSSIAMRPSAKTNRHSIGRYSSFSVYRPWTISDRTDPPSSLPATRAMQAAYM